MAELKTRPTAASVTEFLTGIADETLRADCRQIAAWMEAATGTPPKMWGAGIVGFGTRHLQYESGRELDWMEVGFAPRKQNLVLYITDGLTRYEELLARLGKHRTGKSCLYLKGLSGINETVLQELITQSIRHIRES